MSDKKTTNMEGKRKPTGKDEKFNISFMDVNFQTHFLDEKDKPTTKNTETKVEGYASKDIVLSTELGNNVMSIKADNSSRETRDGESR